MVPHESTTQAMAAPAKVAENSGTLAGSKAGSGLLRSLGRKFPYSALQYLLMSADAAVIAFSSVVGGGFYQLVANGDFKNADQLLGAGIMSALLYVLLGHSSGFYDLRAVFSKRKDAARIFLQWSLVILLLSQLAFLMKVGASFSRGSVLCYGSLAFVLLLISRRFSKRLVVSAVTEGRVQGRAIVLLGTRGELAALGHEEMLERFGLAEMDRVVLSTEGTGGFSMTEEESSALDR